jgi:hypothetical protein
LETLLQLYDKLSISSPDGLVLLSNDGLVKKAAEPALADKPELLIFNSIAKLETYLVALSQEIDQGEAEKIVLLARHFLLNKFLTVQELHRLLLDRYGTQLHEGPPQGGAIIHFQVLPGETAFVGKQNSRWKFQTTVIVQAEASRTITNIPMIREEISLPGRPSATSPSGGTTVPLQASGFAASQGSAGIATTPSITSIPTAISNSVLDVIYSVGDRVVKSFGRHTIRLVWSARLSDDQQELSDFEVQDSEYQGVVWE